MSTPPQLDYSPRSLDGIVAISQFAEVTTLTIRHTRRRFVQALALPFLLALFGALGLLAFFFSWRVGSSHWIALAIPLGLFAVAIASAVIGVWPLCFPVIIEVYPHCITIKWRTLSELHTQSFPREGLRGVTVERIQAAPNRPKQWYLILLTVQQGRLAILQMGMRQKQLELIREKLCAALGMSTAPAPALLIPPIQSCPYKRVSFGAGVVLYCPSRAVRRLQIAMISSTVLVAGAVFAAIVYFGASPWSSKPALAILCLALTGIFGVGTYEIIRRSLHNTMIVATPDYLHVRQTNVLHPLTVTWKAADLVSIKVEPAPNGIFTLTVIPCQPPTLPLLQDRQDYLEWAVMVIRAAMTPPANSNVAAPATSTPAAPQAATPT